MALRAAPLAPLCKGSCRARQAGHAAKASVTARSAEPSRAGKSLPLTREVANPKGLTEGEITTSCPKRALPEVSLTSDSSLESGDRMEFLIPGAEYGMLIQGDCGRLTFQGTRYLGFERG